MSGLLKGLLKTVTFGLIGSDTPSPSPEPEPVPEPTPQQSSIPLNAINAEYFFTSGRRVKNFGYSQLNATEKQIFDTIIEELNDYYEENHLPTEARHITLNKRLSTLDFGFVNSDDLFHVIKEKGEWLVLDDDEFWETFGEGEEVELTYTPPQ